MYLLLALSLIGVAAGRHPAAPQHSADRLPDTVFSCRDKVLGGYYADPDAQCQMFHVCVKVAGVGIQDYRFLCPNGTAFDQEAQICAGWADVACEPAALYYSSDNFDLYRIGSGFESKKAPVAFEDEPDFHLQRAEPDILSGAHSSNFFNNREGKENQDASEIGGKNKNQVDQPQRKKVIKKLQKRPTETAPRPSSTPRQITNNFAESYNPTTSRPVVVTTSTQKTTQAPQYNENYSNYNQRSNNYQSIRQSSTTAAPNYSNDYYKSNQENQYSQKAEQQSSTQARYNGRGFRGRQPSTPEYNYNSESEPVKIKQTTAATINYSPPQGRRQQQQQQQQQTYSDNQNYESSKNYENQQSTQRSNFIKDKRVYDNQQPSSNANYNTATSPQYDNKQSSQYSQNNNQQQYSNYNQQTTPKYNYNSESDQKYVSNQDYYNSKSTQQPIAQYNQQSSTQYNNQQSSTQYNNQQSQYNSSPDSAQPFEKLKSTTKFAEKKQQFNNQKQATQQYNNNENQYNQQTPTPKYNTNLQYDNNQQSTPLYNYNTDYNQYKSSPSSTPSNERQFPTASSASNSRGSANYNQFVQKSTNDYQQYSSAQQSTQNNRNQPSYDQKSTAAIQQYTTARSSGGNNYEIKSTAAPFRLNKPEDYDDGQYRPEVYEKEAGGEYDVTVRQPIRQEAPVQRTPEPELLKAAHSINIAASGNKLAREGKPQAQSSPSTSVPVTQTSKITPQAARTVYTTQSPRSVYSSLAVVTSAAPRPFSARPSTTTTQAPPPPPPPPQKPVQQKQVQQKQVQQKPVQQKPVQQKPLQQKQAPVVHKQSSHTSASKPASSQKSKDVSYDYAYYDNSDHYSEYENIEEFGRTSKKQ